MPSTVALHKKWAAPASSRLSWIGAGIFIAVHGLACYAFPATASIISLAFLTSSALIASWATYRRARASGTPGWSLLAFAQLLWAGGMAANGLVYLALGYETGESIASMLLFILYGVPIIFATASPTREVSPVRLIDGLLALMLGLFFFAHTSVFATIAGASVEGAANLARMFDIENIFIALFALVRLMSCRDPGEREFFASLSIYAMLYMLTAAFINHTQEDTDFGGPVDLLIDLPFLFLALMASHWHQSQRSPTEVPLRLERVIQAVSPLMLPATLLAVSAGLIHIQPVWTMVGFAMATLVYGLRNILVHLSNLEERDRLERLSQIDALTGLPNRRSFDARLHEEWARACRNGGTLAVLMIDIDHFKLLNDGLGHQEGDDRLRDVAETLGRCARRASDMVARYGGEEFVAVLPGINAQQAMQLAEVMRSNVYALALPSPAPAARVTISVGVSWTDRPNEERYETLLSRADTALYEAKRGGRNAVVIAAMPARQTAVA
ncbi:GGDEF domain-containing protein [Novosphingobium guangzhouense]|uniref:GGDEF domain-containing protein n=1 Tax=Novosphingobium guangzhouense TaxID=1850347 RepID=UPI000CCC2E13|nr:GGDEF domain-containing protein [Novosphingobium guangzhouense]